MHLAKGRLRNYPAYEYKTEDEWSGLFAGDMAPTRVRVRSGQPIDWTLRVASLQDFRVAYGAHASDIEIDQFGSGEGLHIHVPQSGQMELMVGETTTLASPERAVLIDFSRPHRLKMERSPGYEAIALNIPKRSIDQHFAAICGDLPLAPVEFEPIVDLTSASGRMLSALTDTLAIGLENGLLARAPIAMANLSQALLNLLAQAGQHTLRKQIDSPAAGPRHVMRAIEFMEANVARPLKSAEIAAAAGVSVRTLEVGFQRFRDTTPIAYLRSLRLKAARAELSLPSNASTIAEVAYRWGFAHLGRFSAMYRKAYGELPSETVARQR